MTWALLMEYTNHAGGNVWHSWPLFDSYQECRYFADLMTTAVERYNGGHVIYALCNEVRP